jgi:hypothetical protein
MTAGAKQFPGKAIFRLELQFFEESRPALVPRP